MGNLLFDSWHQWKVCFIAGCQKTAWGFIRIITCLIFGFLSILRWLWWLFIAFVKKNTSIAVGGFIVLIVLTWLVTFVKMRHRAVEAEFRRDSLSYELLKYTQKYNTGDTKIIVGNDTLTTSW